MNRISLGAALTSLSLISCSTTTTGSARDAGSDGTTPIADAGDDTEDGGARVMDGGDAAGECAIPCGGDCCNTGSVCVSDSAGNKSCAVSCTTSSTCAAPTDCCAVLDGGTSGVCAANVIGVTSCICVTDADCTRFESSNAQTSCAPLAANDVSSGVYVCKPGDAKSWDGCSAGGAACPANYSCWTDRRGNAFCTHSCTSNAACGNAGVACCYGADAGSSCVENEYNQGCGDGPGGCMPCQQ